MLLDCPSVGADIKYCQSQGKLVTLSLGGATFNETIASETQATQFADQIWGLFLGGNSAVRPFGDAVLDGYLFTTYPQVIF
jgi:chitinase